MSAPERGPADRLLRTAENVLAAVGLSGLAATGVLIVVDVALRYLVGAPLSWSVGFVGDYALIGLFFLGLSYTVREGAHVRIDLVYTRLGPGGRRALDLLGPLLTAVFLALVGYGGLVLTLDAARFGDAPLAGASELSWPVWTSAVMVPLGAGLAVLRSLHTLVTVARHGTGGDTRDDTHSDTHDTDDAPDTPARPVTAEETH
ncbi:MULTISPECIES: TRAP transporter small permease [unclassified Pseudonocardia]|uniref:TRAP transporter small permease n=1 Tax=unclassified Pseudonocardia TaxID=2619320 RepID=UPI0001FFE82C|nr:TRAP transporter small permease [Pseudonocardia sp. Ae707_Ps1]OLM17525.1 TRAP dicarboxylate transporter, DctQ subunit, unknown substrate 3 [Pseudonocardia sp. Ae707_Ps1]